MIENSAKGHAFCGSHSSNNGGVVSKRRGCIINSSIVTKPCHHKTASHRERDTERERETTRFNYDAPCYRDAVACFLAPSVLGVRGKGGGGTVLSPNQAASPSSSPSSSPSTNLQLYGVQHGNGHKNRIHKPRAAGAFYRNRRLTAPKGVGRVF